MTLRPSELARIVAIDSLAHHGRAMEVEASEAECRALAGRFGIPAIEWLRAALRLVPVGDGRVRVTGALQASVVQVCVVSLEPFAQTVDAPVAVTFVPRPLLVGQEDGEIDPDGADEEPYDGGRFDVGEVVAQTLSLALDPWPRNAHADPPPPGEPAGTEPTAVQNPFSVLARRRH